MLYIVTDMNQRVLYSGPSWPMARAALDFLATSGEPWFAFSLRCEEN